MGKLHLPKDVDEKHFKRICAECAVFDEEGKIDIMKINGAIGQLEKIEGMDDADIKHIEMMFKLNKWERRIFYGMMMVVEQLRLAECREEIEKLTKDTDTDSLE